MNPYLKNLKIEKFPKKKLESPGIPLTPENFEVEKCYNMNLYNDIVDKIIEDQNKIMNQIICGSFKDYLGCKSGEDMYIILTSVGYLHKYNQIVDLVNEHLKTAMMGFGPDGIVPQISKLSEPLKESDELKHKMINAWEDVYGKDD